MSILAPRSALSACIRVAATLAAAALLAVVVPAGARAATVVSFTFDDGIATQTIAASSLAAHGMQGTFFINSGNVGSSSYFMTWSQVDALAAAGNEIAGHTVDHKRLTDLTADQQHHEICDDASTLRARGYTITDFAYPYGAGSTSATVRQALLDCGYLSARKFGDLYSNGCTDPSCPFTESIPPPDAYAIRTPEWYPGEYTLSDLEGFVTQAEIHGGGWVPLVFHDICNQCADSSVSSATMSAFLDWLQARASSGTVVKTTSAALGGPPPPPPPPPADTTPPTTTAVCNAATCSTGWYKQAVSLTLAASDTGGSGVAATRYTTDGSTPTATSPVYSAPLTVSQPTTVKYRSWDGAGNVEAVRSVTLRVDTVPPTVAITSPANGATITAKQVSVTASAGDTFSGVNVVDFYVDGVKLGTDGKAPFSTGWKTQKGQHSITAAATDAAGNTGALSAPVTVTVR
jgi:peptidoglycan/xylan/chitin deacetylase (PgdA/CDA1 family)